MRTAREQHRQPRHASASDADIDPPFPEFERMLGILLALGLDPGRLEGDTSALDTEPRVIERDGHRYVVTLRLVCGYGRGADARPTTCELNIGHDEDGTLFQLHAFADGRGNLAVIDPTPADEPPGPRPTLPAPGPLTPAQQDEVLRAFAQFLLGLELLDP